MGVDVEFADDFVADENGDDDFGFGFERAGEIAGVGVDVIDDDGFAAGGRGAADALVERNAGVGRHGAFEGAEDEGVASFPFEHVEADPVVAGEFFVEKGDDGFHERFAGCGGLGERVEFGHQVAGFSLCGCHRDYFSVCAGQAQKIKSARPAKAPGMQNSHLRRRPLRKNWKKNWRNLTALEVDTKLLKLSCRGSSLVERRPEKAGVASSILAPGTIRTYIPKQIPLSA